MARLRRHPREFNPFAGVVPVLPPIIPAANDAARGPCVTCHWASGDGARFDCYLRNRITQGEGCQDWEREPGAD
jgi:hypothetical protein